MKQLVTLLVLAGIGFLAYKHHTKQVQLAAEKAAVETKRVMEEKTAAEARRAAAANAKQALQKKPVLQAVAVSKALEPLYGELFAAINQDRPADLVPPLVITKERILDVQAHAEPPKQQVYANAVALLDSMINLAEERTKALETLLKAAKGKGALDSPTSTNTSTAFFAQSTVKRWDEVKTRQKGRLDQLFTQLRATEREWNKQAGKDAPVDQIDLPDPTPVLVTVDQAPPSSSPLEKGAYDQRRSVSPWRRSYYDRYGYSWTYR